MELVPRNTCYNATASPRTWTIETTLIHLLDILLPEQLRDGFQLNVASSFVNRTNLGIPPILLEREISREANAARPFDGIASDLSSYSGRIPPNCISMTQS